MNNIVSFTFYNWLIETGDLGEGPGLWCPLHIILMLLLAAWMVGCWFLFKKYKSFALKLTTVLCYVMVGFRIFRMILLMATGKETVVQALPWHLCHIMAIVFPCFYLTKTKKFFLPIICVTLFGGILTFVFGNYYNYSTFSFLQYESLLLHFLMPTVVIGAVATGYYKIKIEEFWQIPVLLTMLALYASIGNALVPGANYLFLKQNGLPFNLFPGAHFYFTYAILILILAVIFTSPIVIMAICKKHKSKKFRAIVRQKVEV